MVLNIDSLNIGNVHEVNLSKIEVPVNKSKGLQRIKLVHF